MSTITMGEARQMIKLCYAANRTIFLLGDPGIGKSSLFKAVSDELKIGMIDFRLTMRDPVDVGGMRMPNLKTGVMDHFTPSDLPTDLKMHGPKGLLVMDEINVVSPMTRASAYGIIQERRSGQKDLLPGWLPCAAGNPPSSKAAGQRIDTATANRFNIQHVVPDVPSWCDQYGSANVDPRCVAFLRFRPELLLVMPQGDEVRFPSPRSWTGAFKFIDVELKLRRKMIAGDVGDAAADEFEAFMRIMEKATTMDDIIADPMKARLPDERDMGTYYAIAGMISRLLTRQNIKPVMKYVERMIPEFQVVIARDAGHRDSTIRSTSEFGAWVVKHQDSVS